MDSANPKHSEKVAKRFMNAAALCISCCLSSHSIIFRASANISPWSLLTHTLEMSNQQAFCSKKIQIYNCSSTNNRCPCPSYFWKWKIKENDNKKTNGARIWNLEKRKLGDNIQQNIAHKWKSCCQSISFLPKIQNTMDAPRWREQMQLRKLKQWNSEIFTSSQMQNFRANWFLQLPILLSGLHHHS